MVVSGRTSGSGGSPPGDGRSPARMAFANVVRNGAEGGMVKSRGRADEGSGTFALEQGLGFRPRVRRADMHPAPVEPHPVELALGERAVPQQVQREATLERVLEQSLVAQRHPGK